MSAQMSPRSRCADNLTPVQVPLALSNGTIYGTNGQPVTFKGVNWCAQSPCIHALRVPCQACIAACKRCCVPQLPWLAHQSIALPACHASLIRG